MSEQIEECKVYATLKGEEYVIGHVSYPVNSERFELFKDKSQGVIFQGY